MCNLILIICLIFFSDGLNNVKSATVTGCSVSPCTLVRGKNSTFNVNFVAGQYIYYFYLEQQCALKFEGCTYGT